MAQPKPFDHMHAEGPVLTPEESRQGVISGRVLTILTTSLFLAGMAGVALAIYSGMLMI
jgi:hypothetical protein